MQISGSLKRKAVDFYRENIDFYSDKYFKTDNITFFYDGILRSNSDKALRDRQEALILNGIENTLKKAYTRDINSALVAKELELIQNTPRNMSYALFECFYKLVVTATASDDFKLKVYRFAKFREYLCSLDHFTQWELDIMINLFLRDLSFKFNSLKSEEERLFGISSDIYDLSVEYLINFGKFIAPYRVHNIAKDIERNIPCMDYVATIYFALKSDDQAELFKKWCMTESHLDFDKIMGKAELCKIPEPLVKLVKKLDDSANLPF